MKIGSGIRLAMRDKKTSQTELAKRMNENSPQVISNRIRRENSVRVEAALKMLDALGYELIIQPKKAGRRPEGQIVITMEDEV